MSILNAHTVIAGFDFSTGSIKGLAFDLTGAKLAEIHLPTDLWTANGVSELNLFQIEGQVHAAIRGLASQLRKIGRLDDWTAIGISATHHTAGRIDADGNQVRRAICWNDQTLAEYHERGLARLGGMNRVNELIGGPWAIRYSLSHLVKDETTLSESDWKRTRWILPHGPLVAGYMTERFDVTSVSSAASTGIMDLRTNQWRMEMLEALESPHHRDLVKRQLPRIVDSTKPIGPIAEHIALEAGLTTRPVVFPTNDDQQAGLIGGGAVNAGEIAIILGNSAVVNSAATQLPKSDSLDAMRLNWGPYLWLRCYNNGAQFLDHVLGASHDWAKLEKEGAEVPAGCSGVSVLPYLHPEPSRNVNKSWLAWSPAEPENPGIRYRAALEAMAYLIAWGVQEHEAAGQTITRVIVSGGIAKSRLMGQILASVINRPIETLESSEGPALGAAVAAFWGMQPSLGIHGAVAKMVRYRETVQPRADWIETYRNGLAEFQRRTSLHT